MDGKGKQGGRYSVPGDVEQIYDKMTVRDRNDIDQIAADGFARLVKKCKIDGLAAYALRWKKASLEFSGKL